MIKVAQGELDCSITCVDFDDSMELKSLSSPGIIDLPGKAMAI